MADSIKKITYTSVKVPNRTGQGAEVLGELKDAGVDLVAYSGFPERGGKAQLDFVTKDMVGLRRIARREGWKLAKPKKAFLVQGQDKPGAVHRHINKLADARISVTAADAVCAGKGRYGMILWVKPKAYARAARALGAK